ncbi:hypothetical protein MSG28_010004 [Choristoneura fumiferana]|uniref:Uncharacterized protein n=1 Tax=Choristoneura fumiferana TaxID=7141 RepID=A0ACC0KIN1_CHOFU|nr:hypothetical protein MSG28_010004 [Choristoneura fumiferana]
MTDTSKSNSSTIEIYEWSEEIRGVILSSFFWGYTIMQIPAGILAKRFGGKPMLLSALIINGILCLVTPALAKVLGTILTMPVCGLLSQSNLGWTLIFYTMGALASGAAVIWWAFAGSTPREHRWMKEPERDYIESSLNSSGKLNHIDLSPNFGGVMFAITNCFANLIGILAPLSTGFILGDHPTYDWSKKQQEIMLFAFFVGSQFGTIISFQLSGIFCGSSSFGWPFSFWLWGGLALVCFCMLAYFGSDCPQQHKTISNEELAFIMGDSAADAVPKINQIDLAPNFAGPMMGLGNMVANLSGLAIPFLVSDIVGDDVTYDWSKPVQEMILGAFFVGYCLMMFPTGIACQRRRRRGTTLGTVIAFQLSGLLASSAAGWPSTFWVVGSGFLSSLPYIGSFFFCIAYGVLSDYCVNRGYVTLKTTRIVCNTLGTTLGTVIAFQLSGLLASSAAGWPSTFWVVGVNYIDMSPNFSGSLMAVGNTGCGAGVLLLPVLVSNIVTELQCAILFCCITVAYSMRACMGVSLVAMVQRTDDQPLANISDTNTTENGGFLNALLLVPPIPAGQLAHRFGTRYLLTGALMINCIGGWVLTVIFRIIQGLSQSCIVPSMHTAFGKWTPLEERGRLTSFAYGGQALGTVLGMPITGFIAASPLGWPGIFRFYGLLSGLVGGMLWWLGADTPAQHKSISANERRYIEEALGQIPWKKLMRSWGLYAIVVAHTGYNWGNLTLYSEVPAFMDKIMKVNIKANGLLTALPYFVQWFSNFFFSWVTDMIIVKKYLSVTNTRKLANSIGSISSTIGLITLAFVDKDIYVVETILVTICAFSISTNVGYHVNHIDIAPNFAGTLMSISNFVSNCVGSLAPIVAGCILTDVTSEYLWRKVFCVSAGFFFVTNLFYVIFGTAELADWNEPEEEVTKEDEDPMLMKERR